MATSDQWVSLRRSACGKSNRVASIWVVSSIDTLSTQSNVSPIGSESSTSLVRRSVSARIRSISEGPKAGATVEKIRTLKPNLYLITGGGANTLVRVTPDRYRRHAHHWLILHGRYVCKARSPDCPNCTVRELCAFKGKVTLP